MGVKCAPDGVRSESERNTFKKNHLAYSLDGFFRKFPINLKLEDKNG